MDSTKKSEIVFKQVFKNDPLLEEYMAECAKRNYTNNSTIENLKFDYFEHSAFFGVVVNNKIREFAGVHNFDIDGKRYYRIGFRAASIKDSEYSPKQGKNLLKSSIIVGILLPMQIKYIEDLYGPQEFIMTTNLDHSSAGKSHIANRLFMRGKEPAVKKLLYEDVEYLYTRQNVWLMDREVLLNNIDENIRNFTC
jgi:hypothetical protein